MERKPIPFSYAYIPPTASKYINDVLERRRMSGDLSYTKKCNDWFLKYTPSLHTLLTTSCTHALEMSALLLKLQPGDEVIMPSFTFSSTANAFILRGATPVFVDIDPKTMNIDPVAMEAAITKKTKAVVPVHYAGVACDMDTINAIARKNSVSVVEDAAQALVSFYKGKPLGTLSDYGCFSFHETKNITCGEGGSLVIRDPENVLAAEILREKGTNRSQFFRGDVDKYTWLNIGSSFLPSDLNAALLYSQLEIAEQITQQRLAIWNKYYSVLSDHQSHLPIELPFIPDFAKHNGHIFFVKTKDLQTRTNLLAHLKKVGIMATFHYVPLHSSPAGVKYGRMHGEDKYTTKESDRLIRLPIFNDLSPSDQDYILDSFLGFFRS